MEALFAARDAAPEIEPVGWRESDWRRRNATHDLFIGVLKHNGMTVWNWGFQ